MPYVIAQPCVDRKERSCVDVCPVDCIYETDRMLVIHPDECIDCGACLPECPVEAIYTEEDLPPEWREFAAINAAFKDGAGRVIELLDGVTG
jgi:NAD-dependent dihydropyrimidine dehydrogenase PreA subunit